MPEESYASLEAAQRSLNAAVESDEANQVQADIEKLIKLLERIIGSIGER